MCAKNAERDDSTYTSNHLQHRENECSLTSSLQPLGTINHKPKVTGHQAGLQRTSRATIFFVVVVKDKEEEGDVLGRDIEGEEARMKEIVNLSNKHRA